MERELAVSHVHSADMSSESCGVNGENFPGVVPHPVLSVKEFQFMAKSLAVVAPHEYQELLRTCGNDDPSSNNDVSVSRAVKQLLKRTASRWAGVKGEPGYAALSWLVFRMLVEINLKKSPKETTEEVMMMTDSEQAVVHHSAPNRLLEYQKPRLQEGCAAPKKLKELDR